MARNFNRHPVITPVFTSHLDCFWVTNSAHASLKTNYKVLKTQYGVLNASVYLLQSFPMHINPQGGRENQQTGAPDDL
jgi:hypothetical protein